MFLPPPSQKLNRATSFHSKKLNQLKLPIAVCVALASTFAVANNDFPNHIIDNHTVSNSGGFDGVSNGTYNFNNIEVTIGTAENIWPGQGNEAMTGKTTTAFNVYNSTLNAYGTITIINNADHENIGNNNALYAQSNSKVTIDAERVFLASLPSSNKSSYLYRRKDSAVTVNGNSSVSITGQIVNIIGNIDIRDSGSHLNLEIDGPSSYWLGSSSSDNLNLKLSNNATWIYDREQYSLFGLANLEDTIANLEFDSGNIILSEDKIREFISKIEFSDGVKNVHVPDFYIKNDNIKAGPNQHPSVTINNLSGNGGYFLIDLDWNTNQGQTEDTDNSDFITIKNVIGENSIQTVEFDKEKAHLESMSVGDKLYFASVEEGTTTFTTNADGEVNNADEVFAFTYATDSEVLEDKYGKSATYWFLTKETGRTNENVDFLESAPLVTYALATDLDRLHDRMNEAVLDDHKNGLWARYRFSKTGFDEAFETDAHMIQVGYNHDVSTADSRKFVGLAFDYTSADTDLDGLSGNGDSERYALSAYYTVLANCGGYADIVGKIGRIGSDYDLRNNLGAAIGSSFWQTYYGISAEFGWKYQATKSFFFEPQTQLQVMRIEGDNFTTKGGVRAEIDDINSIIGRLGFRTGFTLSFSDALPASSVYMLADVLHEFNGDNAFRATGRTTAYEDNHAGSQTWYDVGIGTNLSLSEKAKVLMNAKYVAGGDFDSSWALNADLRYEF